MKANRGTDQQTPWRDTLRHIPRHPWTIAPLAAAATGAAATITIPDASVWTVALTAAAAGTAALNAARILIRVKRYTEGVRDRPHFIRPTAQEIHHEARTAAPDGLYSAEPSGRYWVCNGCGKGTKTAYESKTTQEGTIDMRSFGLCDPCLANRRGPAAKAIGRYLRTGRMP